MSADDVLKVVFPPMPWQVAVLIYPLTLSLALCVGSLAVVVWLALICWRGGWHFGGWAFEQWEAGRA